MSLSKQLTWILNGSRVHYNFSAQLNCRDTTAWKDVMPSGLPASKMEWAIHTMGSALTLTEDMCGKHCAKLFLWSAGGMRRWSFFVQVCLELGFVHLLMSQNKTWLVVEALATRNHGPINSVCPKKVKHGEHVKSSRQRFSQKETMKN